MEHIRAIIGPEEQSGFTDSFIEDTLWDTYFDVESSVKYILGKLILDILWSEKLRAHYPASEVHEKRMAVKERKGERLDLHFLLNCYSLSYIFARCRYSYCIRLPFPLLSVPLVFSCREGRCHPLSLNICLAITRERRCISPRLTSPDPVPALQPPWW